MGTLGNKFQMNRVYLVLVMCIYILEDHGEEEIIGIVNHWSLGSWCWFAKEYLFDC